MKQTYFLQQLTYFFTTQSSLIPGFSLRCFRGPIQVPRIENRVPRIRENYHRVPRIKENRVLRIREIGSLQVHTRYLTFSLKKPCLFKNPQVPIVLTESNHSRLASLKFSLALVLASTIVS